KFIVRNSDFKFQPIKVNIYEKNFILKTGTAASQSLNNPIPCVTYGRLIERRRLDLASWWGSVDMYFFYPGSFWYFLNLSYATLLRVSWTYIPQLPHYFV